jgi:xanthine dehydrogenase accessory factor
MKEIADILSAIEELPAGGSAVLATVVDLRGSGYRRPGARMLILPNGSTIGTVSGGCLEADVLERATRVLASGKAEIFTYDTTVDEASVFSMNMGCRGVIRILLESVGGDSELIRRLRLTRSERQPQTIATVISHPTEPIGTHYYLQPDGVNTDPIAAEVLHGFSASCSNYDVRTIDASGLPIEFACEVCQPPVRIMIFGAGADAIPLARVAAGIGWQVIVRDHRPAFLTLERFTETAELILGSAEDQPDIAGVDNRTAAVVMTHNYDRDRHILPALLLSNAFYIGALGPKSRTLQLLDEVAAAGQVFTQEQTNRLYAPVGMDIGADTPESIALAIAAEIQSVLTRRSGSHLRDRLGPIYERSSNG